jgi:hypothetical protein
MVNAGRRALHLLHSLLLDEGLRLAAEVACLRCRGFGHNPKQRRRSYELLSCSRRCVLVVDVEVSVVSLSGLSVFFRELDLELAWLG